MKGLSIVGLLLFIIGIEFTGMYYTPYLNKLLLKTLHLSITEVS